MKLRFIWGILFVVSLLGCENQTQQSSSVISSEPVVAEKIEQTSSKAAHVIESFEVGQGVFVRALTEDQVNHSLWIGTSLGVHEIDLKSFEAKRTFTRDHGLANEYVFSVFVDAENRKWFGTNGGGLTKFKEGDWETIFPMHGLADYWVYAFNQDREGNVWVGTWYGANKIHAKSGKIETYLDELVNEWVYGIAIDSKQNIWFGTEGGVTRFDGKTWQSWTQAEGVGAPNSKKLPLSFNTGLGTRSRHDLNLTTEGRFTYNPGYVLSMLAASDDRIWAGTWGGGVSYFDGKRWSTFTEKDGLGGNIVLSMAEDNNGILWFGTNKGLSSYDGKAWHTYNRADGLLSDKIFAVVATSTDEIWVGSTGGVTRLGMPKN